MCHLDLPRDQFRSTEQPPPAGCTTLAPPPPLSYGYGQLKLPSSPPLQLLLLASTVHVLLEQFNTPVTDVGPQRRHCRHHWKHTTDEYTRDRFRSTEGDTGAAANSHCHAWLPSGIALCRHHRRSIHCRCHQQLRCHRRCQHHQSSSSWSQFCLHFCLPVLLLLSFVHEYFHTCTPHLHTVFFVFVSVPALCYVLAPSNLHCLLYAAGSLYA